MTSLDWPLPNNRRLTLDATAVMGVLNLTPDSFSDGGRFGDVDAAVAEGLAMAAAGAAVIDVGGESTRPGAQRIDPDEQARRVVEPIRRLRATLDTTAHADVAISIDTTRAQVATAALDAGAAIVNDVSAGRDDHAMLATVADRQAPIVLMHMLGQPATMQADPRYDEPGGVVAAVERFLLDRAAAAQAAGIPADRIALDPGIGFGKTTEHNQALLAALPRLVALGYPVVLGASRKRFLAAASPATAANPADRLAGTCVVSAAAARAGVALVRVHDVAPNRQAVDVQRWLERNFV